jgi:hypothetical protein
MRKSPFITVFTTRMWGEADEIMGRLRKAGLHPADLSLTTPLTPPGANPTYPIEVPVEEVDLAREVMKSLDPSRN